MRKTATNWLNKYQITDKGYANLPAHQVACPDCAEIVTLPELKVGQNAYCPKCNHQLASIPVNPFIGPIAYSVTAILLMIYSSAFSFMGLNVNGVDMYITIPKTIINLFQQDFSFLSNVMFILLFGTPQVFLLLNIYVHYALYAQKKLPHLATATRILFHLKPWMMVDVFIISVLVACVKVQSMGTIEFGTSFWTFCAFALVLVRTSLFIQPHWLHYQIKKLNYPTYLPLNASTQISCHHCLFFNPLQLKKCSVCQTPLEKRRNRSLEISFALLLTAIIFYFPANLYPMMITQTIFETYASTIFEGVIILWQEDSKPIAIIILIASVMIPIIKMFSLMILLFSAKFKLLASPHVLTKLYRAVEFVGRWSMIDVFVVILMMALIQMRVAKIFPGQAVFYFCIVVIFSMISVMAFDIRLIWDKSKLVNKNE